MRKCRKTEKNVLNMPYKQRVGGSNPSAPTKEKELHMRVTPFFATGQAGLRCDGEPSALPPKAFALFFAEIVRTAY